MPLGDVFYLDCKAVGGVEVVIIFWEALAQKDVTKRYTKCVVVPRRWVVANMERIIS